MIERLVKLLVSPSEAMEDIAAAPDYMGVFAVIATSTVLSALAIFSILQKFSFTGTHASEVSSFVVSILTLSVFLIPILFVVRWLMKSLIVKYFCDSGSGWGFGTAASATGYAYLPEILVGLVGIVVVWFALPSFTVATSSLEAAQQSISSQMAEISWLRLCFSLPASFVGLAWKSYLGGLGAHFGTKGSCSVKAGFALFFVLGLVGLLLSYLI